MIKWIILLVAGYLLIKMLSTDRRKKTEEKKADVSEKVATGEMVKDPICGAFVSKDSDIRVRNGEQVLHFCSYDCREKYLAQVEKQSEAKEIDG